MAIEQHKLSNGATFLFDPIPHLETAAIGWFFGVGARFETKNQNGIAHFSEHLAFKSTKNRTTQEIAREFARMGAYSNAWTSKEMTAYYGSSMAEDVVAVDRILHDLVTNQAFNESEVDTERGAIISEIGEDYDTASDHIFELLYAEAYKNQPYGRSILGPSENVERFTAAEFRKWSKHYNGNNLIVSVAGNVDPQKILKELEKTAGTVPAGKKAIYKPAKYSGGSVYEHRDDKNIQVALAFNAAAVGDEKSTAENVMAIILGGGMSSRLFTEVREKRGLVYTTFAQKSGSFDTGNLTLYAGVGAEKTDGVAALDKLTPSLCDEIKKMREEKVTDQELEDAKKAIAVGTIFSLETASSRMEQNAERFYFKGSAVEGKETLAKVNAVTKDDILDAAQRIFATKPTLAVIGKANLRYDAVVKSLKL